MVEFHILLVIFYMGLTGLILLINTFNPVLIHSLKMVILGCLGVPGLMIEACLVAMLQKGILFLRGQNTYSSLPSTVLIVLYGCPVIVLEWALPGQGWLLSMLAAGLVWGMFLFSSAWLHRRRRRTQSGTPAAAR